MSIKVDPGKHHLRLKDKKTADAEVMPEDYLSARTAHDLRSGLNAIIGYSEILKDALVGHQCLTADQVAEYVDHIISRSWRLLTSINHISASRTAPPCPSDENWPFMAGCPTKHSGQGGKNNPLEIISVQLDYDIESRNSLLEALKKAEHQCLNIMKAMIIREVDAFGATIIQIGNTFQSAAIKKWGQALKTHAANFNKQEMELMMQWFPEIVLNVETEKPGKTAIKMID